MKQINQLKIKYIDIGENLRIKKKRYYTIFWVNHKIYHILFSKRKKKKKKDMSSYFFYNPKIKGGEFKLKISLSKITGSVSWIFKLHYY